MPLSGDRPVGVDGDEHARISQGNVATDGLERTRSSDLEVARRKIASLERRIAECNQGFAHLYAQAANGAIIARRLEALAKRRAAFEKRIFAIRQLKLP